MTQAAVNSFTHSESTRLYGLPQYPARAFQPEYHWEPNTPNRVNAYFEELDELGDSSAEIQGVLYEGTEALEVSVDVDEPLVFRPSMEMR
ncbi:hypothetical protein V5799_009929 [Amblyomma americanum]|uniref:Uncharacterized protein n=1 Tax=Amblyomma americanum TaxID=6943 RepID=A0AAQ4F9I0_AMBAM